MTESDEIEVTAKPDSFCLKAKGGAASRLGHQIADVISPFSGLLGAIGDHVDQYRMLRKEAAAAALLRARELKLLAGEQPHPVSQKILAPWLEGASTEDLGTENLLELWARILAKSPEEVDAAFLRYIDITKNIGPKEAEFFQEFMGHYVSTQIPEGFFSDTSLGTKNHNLAATENGNRLVDFGRTIFDADGELLRAYDLTGKIEAINSLLVGQVVHFMALPKRNESAPNDTQDHVPHLEWIDWDHPKSSEIEILRLIGLVRTSDARDRARLQQGPVIALQVLEPTALGCSFYFGIIASEGKGRQ